jgi:hypothetical protein
MRYPLTFLTGILLISGCNKPSIPANPVDLTPPINSSWTVPQNPNPRAILTEAEADAKAGKYDDALAKQVWFYTNALKYNSGLSGVRLSFALSDWIGLGKAYPPALEKLKAFRDAAEMNVRRQTNVVDNFQDFAAINKELNEDPKTVDLFVWLDSNKSSSPKTVFDLAQPALVKSGKYPLLGKYTQAPYAIFDKAVQSYQKNIKLAQDPKFGTNLKDFADHKFINDVTTLIALLVVTDRKADAQRIVEEIKTQPGIPKFDEQIQKALNGEVPQPWP